MGSEPLAVNNLTGGFFDGIGFLAPIFNFDVKFDINVLGYDIIKVSGLIEIGLEGLSFKDFEFKVNWWEGIDRRELINSRKVVLSRIRERIIRNNSNFLNIIYCIDTDFDAKELNLDVLFAFLPTPFWHLNYDHGLKTWGDKGFQKIRADIINRFGDNVGYFNTFGELEILLRKQILRYTDKIKMKKTNASKSDTFLNVRIPNEKTNLRTAEMRRDYAEMTKLINKSVSLSSVIGDKRTIDRPLQDMEVGSSQSSPCPGCSSSKDKMVGRTPRSVTPIKEEDEDKFRRVRFSFQREQ